MIRQWEEWLRLGHFHSINNDAELQGLDLSSVPRNWAVKIAELLRRSNRSLDGMKVLAPVVREGRPTDEEILEYSQMLRLVGAAEEANHLLQRIDEKERPQVFLQRAANYVVEWEYQKAYLEAEKYLNAGAGDAYQRAVVRVNMAAALVFLHRFEAALSAIVSLREDCRKNDWARLAVNCDELEGQIAVLKKDFGLAEEVLGRAMGAAISDVTIDKYFVKKWLAIARAARTGDSSLIEDMRKETVEKQRWESLRDLDLYGLWAKFDQQVLEKVYFGTPYGSYRARIKIMYPSLPSEYHVNGRQANVLDLATGKSGNGQILRPGKNSHRLLSALLTDFYKPLKLGSLFGLIYPGENYDPATSDDRVQHVIMRARREFDEVGFNAAVVGGDGSYRLELGGDWCVRKNESIEAATKEQVIFAQFLVEYGEKAFRTKDLVRIAKVSPATGARIIKKLEEMKLIEASGQGKNTVYLPLVGRGYM